MVAIDCRARTVHDQVFPQTRRLLVGEQFFAPVDTLGAGRRHLHHQAGSPAVIRRLAVLRVTTQHQVRVIKVGAAKRLHPHLHVGDEQLATRLSRQRSQRDGQGRANQPMPVARPGHRHHHAVEVFALHLRQRLGVQILLHAHAFHHNPPLPSPTLPTSGEGANTPPPLAGEVGRGSPPRQPRLRQPYPETAAQRNEVVVEVVVRVVQGAWPFAVAGHAVVAVAVADDEVGAGLVLQHERKIFRPHRRHELVHRLRTHHLHHYPPGELGLGRVVDGGRIVALERKLAAHAEGRRGVGGDVAHAGFDQIQRLGAEGARRALNLGIFGNHIGRLAGMNHGDRDYRRVERGAVAGDDGLKRLHHLAGRRHRVDAQMRHGRVRALAGELDVKLIA